jgi:NADH:ubiquinone oxidoreductase subunit K
MITTIVLHFINFAWNNFVESNTNTFIIFNLSVLLLCITIKQLYVKKNAFSLYLFILIILYRLFFSFVSFGYKLDRSVDSWVNLFIICIALSICSVPLFPRLFSLFKRGNIYLCWSTMSTVLSQIFLPY